MCFFKEKKRDGEAKGFSAATLKEEDEKETDVLLMGKERKREREKKKKTQKQGRSGCIYIKW